MLLPDKVRVPAPDLTRLAALAPLLEMAPLTVAAPEFWIPITPPAEIFVALKVPVFTVKAPLAVTAWLNAMALGVNAAPYILMALSAKPRPYEVGMPVLRFMPPSVAPLLELKTSW